MRSVRPFLVLVLLLSLLPLSACRPNRSKAVRGYGVKGPLALADASASKVDPQALDLKGALLDTGSTNAEARTQGLAIPNTTQGPILLEFTTRPDTLDLTTGAPPLIATLRTLVDAQRVKDGDTLFATPLTTLAVDLAADNADVDGDGSVTQAELDIALTEASEVVASTLGFGLLSGVDIFATPALLTAETVTPEAQEAVARYRTASEALAAVVSALLDEATTSDANEVLAGLAEDLSDEVLDGEVDGVPVTAFAGVADPVAVVTQDPSTLLVPGTNIPVGDVETLLAAEIADTGVSVPTEALTSGAIDATPSVASPTPDSDEDGVSNVADTCPLIPNPSQQPAQWGGFAWGGDCWQ